MTVRLSVIWLSADKSALATVAHDSPLRISPLSEKHIHTVIALATSSLQSAQKAAEAHGAPKDKACVSAEVVTNDLMQTRLRSM